jgi:hypothetical protein
MRTSVIAIITSLVLVGAAFAQEHPTAKPAAAGGGVLDGKMAAGELGKSGEKKGDKDQLTFKEGKFVSSACVAYGFHETAYTATEKDGVFTFASTPTNAKGETMSWTGTIKQGVVDAIAVNKTPSGETTYWFKGTLGASAKSNEHPKKSEHPDHPKN